MRLVVSKNHFSIAIGTSVTGTLVIGLCESVTGLIKFCKRNSGGFKSDNKKIMKTMGLSSKAFFVSMCVNDLLFEALAFKRNLARASSNRWFEAATISAKFYVALTFLFFLVKQKERTESKY